MTDPATDNSQNTHQLIERGLERLNSGRIEEAKDCFLHALRLEPDKPETLINLGYALLHLGEVGEGGQVLRKFLSMFPSHEDVIANYISFLLDAGKHDNHVRACLEMIPSCPDNGPLLSQLARGLYATGNFDEIEADKDRFAQCSLSHVARSCLARGQYTEAFEAYGKLLSLVPGSYFAALELIKAVAGDLSEGDLRSSHERCRRSLSGTEFSGYPVWLSYQLARYYPCEEDLDAFEKDMELKFPSTPASFSPVSSGLSRRVYDFGEIRDLKRRFQTPRILSGQLKDNIGRFRDISRQLIKEGAFRFHQKNIEAFKRNFGDGGRDPVFVLSTGRCGTLSLHEFLQRSKKVCPYHTFYWQISPLDRNHLLYRILSGDFDKESLAKLLGLYVEIRAAEILYAIRNNQTPVIINHWDTVFAPFNAELFPGSRFLYLHRDDEKVFRSIYGKNQWQNVQLQYCWYDAAFQDGKFTHFFDDTLEIEEEISWYLYVTREFSRAFLETMPKDRVLAIESEDMFGGSEETFNEIRRIIPVDDLGYSDFADHFSQAINSKMEKQVIDHDEVDRRAARFLHLLDGLGRHGKFQ